MAKIFGVDFSHWQANVNFDKLVDNDVRFAIFKAGEIPTTSKSEFTDPKYKRNIAEARRTRIISGAYYYFHPSIGASRQARHFDAVMQRDGQPDLPPVIDVEDTDQRTPVQVADVLKAMIDYMMDRGYRRPIIYSRWGFLVNQVGEPYWLKDHYLWLAQYSTELIYKPRDMSNVIMWQFTDRLKLPGVGVALDGNYWLKSERELLALVQTPQTAAQPELEPQPQPQPVEIASPAAEETPAEQPQSPEPVAAMQQQVREEPEEIIIPAQPVPVQTAPVQEAVPEVIEDSVLPDSPQSAPQNNIPVTPPPASRPATPLSLWDIIQRFINALFTSFRK